MLYSVSEASESIGLSKQSIYNKLKLKELQGHIVKKQGITYIDDIGLNLIKDSLNNLKIEKTDLNCLNIKNDDTTANEEVATDTADLKLDDKLYNVLIKQLETKDKQIEEKDIQIHELHKLIENNQVLLKDNQDVKQLEQHFRDLDNKLIEVREQMQQRKNKKSIFNIFKKE